MGNKKKVDPMDKLYVVVRRDLPPGPQAVQSCHAAIQYCMEHDAKEWFRVSNHLAVLSAANEDGLKKLILKARTYGIKFSTFQEPDLDDSITAVAFEPGNRGRKLCSGLPLALKEEAKVA